VSIPLALSVFLSVSLCLQPPPDGEKTGLLPMVLEKLISMRREVKKLIQQERNPAKLVEYDIRQKVCVCVSVCVCVCV
jgi:hypothetical protein